MRIGYGVIAGCGIVGLLLGAAVADDGSEFFTSVRKPAPTGKSQFFPRTKVSEPGEGLEQATTTTTARRTEVLSGSAASGKGGQRTELLNINGAKTAPQIGKNYYRELFADEQAQAENGVVHAGFHEAADGAKEHGTIQHVNATADTGFGEFASKPQEISTPEAKSEAVAVEPESHTVAASAATEGPQSPSVTLKWVKPGEVNVGQNFDCSLVVVNTCSTTVTDVTVDAYLPRMARAISAEPTPTEGSDHISWNFAQLAPGEEQTMKIRLVPSKAGDMALSANVRFSATASAQFAVQEPKLKIELQGSQQALVGEPASQIILVSNPGTGMANNVTITAVIPKGLEHARGEKLAIDIGSLGAGESRPIQLSLVATSGGTHRIEVEAASASGLRTTATADVTVAAPSVKVVAEGPALRYVGRTATYTFSVTNDGSAATSNVRIAQRVAEGFDFVRADQGGQFDPSSRIVKWFVGRLEAGQSAKVQVDLTATQLGTFTHQVAATSEHGARDQAQIETAVDGTASLDLQIVDQNDPIEVGAETSYEVQLRNEGSKAAEQVSIVCELSPEVEFVNSTGATAGTSSGNSVTFKTLDKLNPGQTATFHVTVRGRSAGAHRFRVRLASDSNTEPLTFEELTKFYAE